MDLIAKLYGPVEGRRHDAGLLKESGLLNILQREARALRGETLCLYRDPANPLRPQLVGLYRDADVLVVTPEMSKVRVSVEWLFGDIAEHFKFIDYKKNLKIGMSAVAKQYIVSTLFRNILTCLYSNTTSELFYIEPPTLMEYLA